LYFIFRIILSTGNCDYISNDKKLTRAAIIAGSIYGLAVISFVLLALVSLRKGVQHEEYHPNEKQYHKNNSFDELEGENAVEIFIDDNQSRGEI
jgi:hypothetical protein